MFEALKDYLPEKAIMDIESLLRHDNLSVVIKNERKTKHGDYRSLANGKHQITVNANLNKYRFLITLIHEIAHFEAFLNYGKLIKPHGIEWKRTFQRLMLPFINPSVFPESILPTIANHFRNPKASSNTDSNLVLALSQFDEPNDKSYVFEIPEGSNFRMYNGRIFKKGIKRRKRYECIEIHSGKLYLFNPNAQVEFINE